MLYLDGGVVLAPTSPITFAGYTTATYTGNLGGQVGANAKCQAQYAGSFFCTFADFDGANVTTAPGGNGVWIDGDRSNAGSRNTGSCQTGLGAWSDGTNNSYGYNLTANGSFYTTQLCGQTKPLACCNGITRRVNFRGYTTATYTGNLGGQVGANAKCQTQYPGSFFCTFADFDGANVTAAPGGNGVWIDGDRNNAGSRNANSCQTGLGAWSDGTNNSYGYNMTANGSFYTTQLCGQTKPLACCQSY